MSTETLLTGRDIVLLSSAPWAAEGRLNCHHVAARLAAKNRVLYIESAGLRAPSLRHSADVKKVLQRLGAWLRGRLTGLPQVIPNLHLLSPLMPPFHSRPRLAKMSAIVLRSSCMRAVSALDFRSPALWAFLPTGAHLLQCLGWSAVIYHCVDDYAGNPGVNARLIAEQEQRLVRAADLCFATSRPLADRLSAMGGLVHCVPNVAEVERFYSPPARTPGDIASIPRPRIGYIGNVAAYKLDIELLSGLAACRPEWSLILIGQAGGGDPSTRLDELPKHPNVHLLGPRPYAQIPDYVHALDVCLIPFRRSRVTDSSLPLKTFEYLAAGKPVVSTPIASLRAEPLDEVIEYAEGAEGFAEAIGRCLSEDTDRRRDARRKAAARYSWERRFPEISSRANEVLKGRPSAGESRCSRTL